MRGRLRHRRRRRRRSIRRSGRRVGALTAALTVSRSRESVGDEPRSRLLTRVRFTRQPENIRRHRHDHEGKERQLGEAEGVEEEHRPTKATREASKATQSRPISSKTFARLRSALMTTKKRAPHATTPTAPVSSSKSSHWSSSTPEYRRPERVLASVDRPRSKPCPTKGSSTQSLNTGLRSASRPRASALPVAVLVCSARIPP